MIGLSMMIVFVAAPRRGAFVPGSPIWRERSTCLTVPDFVSFGVSVIVCGFFAWPPKSRIELPSRTCYAVPGVRSATGSMLTAMPLWMIVAATSLPLASSNSIEPAPSVTVRGSSGSEHTSRIVDVSNIGRNASGFAGSPPLTATRVGGAARGRSLRVVKVPRGPVGKIAANGARALVTLIVYCAPGSQHGESTEIARPSADTVGVTVAGPFGPVLQKEGNVSAVATTGSLNATTSFVPSGTSTCLSTGYVKVTPGCAVCGGAVVSPHANRTSEI